MGKKHARKKIRQQPAENPVLKGILMRIGGEHGCEIAEHLAKEELTDDELAKKMGVRVNLVRRILYDLYENRVVNYRRVRDEHSGWYVYYWRVEPERAIGYFNENRRLLLQKLERRLEVERNTMFFACREGCPKVQFTVAAENDFKCPRCGGKLEPYDNSSVIKALERQVESLRQQLAGS